MDDLDIALLGAGDTDTVHRLVDLYGARVFRYLGVRLGSDRAPDFTAEVFREAVERTERFSTDASSVPAWLFGIASRAADRGRRTEKGHVGGGRDRSDGAAAVAAAVLADLKPDQRNALLLVMVGGLPPAEAAEAMDSSVVRITEGIGNARAALTVSVDDDAVSRLAPGPPDDLSERVMHLLSAGTRRAAVATPLPIHDTGVTAFPWRSTLVAMTVAVVVSVIAVLSGSGEYEPPPVPPARVDWGMLVDMTIVRGEEMPIDEARQNLERDLAILAERTDAAGVEVAATDGPRVSIRMPAARTEDEILSFLSPRVDVLRPGTDPESLVEDLRSSAHFYGEESQRFENVWDESLTRLRQRGYLTLTRTRSYGSFPSLGGFPALSPVDGGGTGSTSRWRRLAEGHFDGEDYVLAGVMDDGELVAAFHHRSDPGIPTDVLRGSGLDPCLGSIGTPRAVACAVEDETTGRTVRHRSFGRVQDGVGRITVHFAGVTRDAVIQGGFWFAQIDVPATPTTKKAPGARISARDVEGDLIPVVPASFGDECCIWPPLRSRGSGFQGMDITVLDEP